MTDLAEVAGRFADLLHRAGVPVTPERAARFAEAVALVRPLATDELYWTARVTLLSDVGQLAPFDRVFAQVFRGLVDVADHRGDSNAEPLPRDVVPGAPARGAAGAPSSAGRPRPRAPGTAEGDGERGPGPVGDEELLRRKDFGTCTPDELVRLRALMAELALVAPRRPSRRTRPHRGGGRVDLRATLRRAHRTGGDPARLAWRARRDRPRRVVLLADVSGSMEAYSRAYLYLLLGAVRALRAEAFVFSTRLTRLTRHLAPGDPDAALTRAMADAPDWASGTRIGAALQAFNDGWGRRGLARQAVVVVVSDGWEGGDPSLLGREMERLSRLAHRIVWVNPRKQHDDYRPLVGGMAAALPYVDVFVSGHSVAALEEVVAAIAQ